MEIEITSRDAYLTDDKFYTVAVHTDDLSFISDEMKKKEFFPLLLSLQEDICYLLNDEDQEEWIKIIKGAVQRAGYKLVPRKSKMSKKRFHSKEVSS